MTDDDALIDLVAAHRPYGMDCKCGRPINSDRDWAHHLAQMLGLDAADRPPPPLGGLPEPTAEWHDDIQARHRSADRGGR